MYSDIFFFSSRRRHTRFDCDWSSDVCSSDLLAQGDRRLFAGDVTERLQELAVPGRGDSLTCRVRPRHVRPRGDTGVALLADVPVLAVGLVPEPHRIVGIGPWGGERGGGEQPIACAARPP